MGGIVRAAVVGGRRGRGYRRAFAALPDEVQLAAICDRDPAVLTEWAEAFPDVPRFAAFEELLAADVCDAVFLATPIQAHSVSTAGSRSQMAASCTSSGRAANARR